MFGAQRSCKTVISRNIPASKRVIHINWPFHSSISLWPLGQLLLWGFSVDCSTFQTRSASESCRSLSVSKIAIRLRSKIVDALTQHSTAQHKGRQKERERKREGRRECRRVCCWPTLRSLFEFAN